jgi:hypothetical protein
MNYMKISTNLLNHRYLIVTQLKSGKFKVLFRISKKSKALMKIKKIRLNSNRSIRLFDLKIPTYQNRIVLI